jgi:hypothetical protein
MRRIRCSHVVLHETELDQGSSQFEDGIESSRKESVKVSGVAVEEANSYCVGTSLSMGESPDKMIFFTH